MAERGDGGGVRLIVSRNSSPTKRNLLKLDPIKNSGGGGEGGGGLITERLLDRADRGL